MIGRKNFLEHILVLMLIKKTLNKCLDYKNEHIPDSLFKYSKVRNVISLLSDDLMYLPKIEDLNDPFECNIFYDLDIVLGKFIDNLDKFVDYSKFDDEIISENESFFISEFLKQPFIESFEKILSEVEDNFKNKTSIICLSEDYCITPMWAHYADNHKGVCIEYDFKNISNFIFELLCFPIEYVKESDNTLELSALFDDNIKTNPNWPLRLVLRKSHNWKYEKEWRIIVSQFFKDFFYERNHGDVYFDEFYSDKHYVKFIEPKSVYLGLNIDSGDEEKIMDICKFRKINVYKMKKDKLGYNLKSEPKLEF